MSSFEAAVRDNDTAVRRSSISQTKSRPKSSTERKSEHKTKDSSVTGESTTQFTDSSSSIDESWAVSREDNQSLGDGSFQAAEDFDFDEDPVNATDEKSTKKKKHSKSSGKTKSSSKHKNATQRQSKDESADIFQVTFNGEENDTTKERIRRSLMRKEETHKSHNSDGSSFVGGSANSHNVGEDVASWSLWAGGEQPARRSSLDNGVTSKKKFGGSTSLTYGTPECEAYLKSLPPAFQLSEKRRLQQKQEKAGAAIPTKSRSKKSASAQS